MANYICLTNDDYIFYSSCQGMRVIHESRKNKHTKTLFDVCKSKIKPQHKAEDCFFSFYFKSTQGHKTKSKFLFLNKVFLQTLKSALLDMEARNLKYQI